MPGFTLAAAGNRPFCLSSANRLNRRALATLEKAVKGPMFGCRMCGNCLLQETAFICSMDVPKGCVTVHAEDQLLNVATWMKRGPCIWYKIYERSFAMGREDRLLEVLPPLDWGQGRHGNVG